MLGEIVYPHLFSHQDHFFIKIYLSSFFFPSPSYDLFHFFCFPSLSDSCIPFSDVFLILFMYRRRILCTLHIAVDVYIVIDFLGPNGTRSASYHFRAQKIFDYQGPSLPVALVMDLPASKSLRPAPYNQPIH